MFTAFGTLVTHALTEFAKVLSWILWEATELVDPEKVISDWLR
jgi:hypothetical protein